MLSLEEYREREKRERTYLGERIDDVVLGIIARKFGVNQACFQGGRGSYDPLDAMRRDAYREVYHWLKKQVYLYRKEKHK